jgi:hypothetical protein
MFALAISLRCGGDTEQSAVRFLDRATGGDAEFLVEGGAGAFVDADRLGNVSLCFEGGHQEGVAGLAQRRVLDQGAGGTFGRGLLGAADAKAAGGVRLERSVEDVVELLAPAVEPRRIVLREQPTFGDELSAQRGAPSPLPRT